MPTSLFSSQRNSPPWQLSDFDYPLPDSHIAQVPADPRDTARLLVSRTDRIEDRIFYQLDEMLMPGDVLVINDTKVIQARLEGKKPTGGRVEVFLTRPMRDGCWMALVGSNKPIRPPLTVTIAPGFQIVVLEPMDGQFKVRLEADDAADKMIHKYGLVPLPPYIQSSGQKKDRKHYQTVFAHAPGAVAAPTAGLHITKNFLKQVHKRGVNVAKVTLHVGVGTFQPVRHEDLSAHHMHAEWCSLGRESAEKINAAREKNKRIIAVGTTAVRTLETAVDSHGVVQPFEGDTSLFILPGYRFQAVDAMITNFHLPKSTLLMLVAAFIGRDRLDRDYAHALKNGYRFYSYGDTSFLLPASEPS
ncbi:MAG: tRNA preQ1(34) S-adenosylmethionine ribosyltransferase-isomerase QueA [Magnetococcales bacterium]|nr:tRNA preQ1(34) S-adenosylmethionine ribosyltransferase-isomerase QueA [Magnetococcales bacterium]